VDGSRLVRTSACCGIRAGVYGGVLVTCPDEHKHSNYCYAQHKCRCDRCRAARSEFARRWYLNKSAEERTEYNARRRWSKKIEDAMQFEDWQLAVAERILANEL
jgi:hypothetical protein